MRKIAIALLALLFAAPAFGQGGVANFPQTVPPNTVVGRLGIAPGPTQAIPFTTLVAQLRGLLTSSIDLRSYSSTVCTGHDDTLAFQNAVNAAGVSGQTIVLPGGACRISSPGVSLREKQNVRITGQGAGPSLSSGNVTSITYTSATGSMFSMDAANAVKIDHVSLYASNTSYNGDLIDLGSAHAGSRFTESVTISDCFMEGFGTSASSLINVSNTLSVRIERCFFQQAAQVIKGGAVSNNVYIANNFFNQGSSTSHIGVQGEGWTLINNTFEPSIGTVANNITANGALTGLSIIGNTFNDGSTGTPISLTGGVVTGLSITGNIIQGGSFSINAGSAVGVSITGNSFLANNICNLIINSAAHVTVLGNSNGAVPMICFRPSGGGAYLADENDGASFLFASGLNLGTPLSAANGGTGMVTYTIGDIIVANGGASLARLNDVAVNNVLCSGGVGAQPSYCKPALAALAAQAANTVVANATSGSASPTAFSMPSCSSATQALAWATNSGFACNGAITATSMATTGLTGTLQAAQEPAHTGDVTNTAGSLALSLVAGNAGNLNSGTLLAARMPALTGDCTTSAGAVATNCTKTSGVAFGALATTTPGTGVATALGNALNGTGGVMGVPGAWTSYTATITPTAGSITTQSSNSSSLQYGKLVFLDMTITVSNHGTGTTAASINLPVAPLKSSTCFGRESAVVGQSLVGQMAAGSTTMSIFQVSGALFTLADGDIVNLNCSYQAQ